MLQQVLGLRVGSEAEPEAAEDPQQERRGGETRSGSFPEAQEGVAVGARGTLPTGVCAEGQGSEAAPAGGLQGVGFQGPSAETEGECLGVQ